MTITKEARLVLHDLNERCEDSIQNLGRIISIHQSLDIPPGHEIDGDPTYLPRLRKAMMHVGAMIQWEMNEDSLHVMAPEIRAAANVLDPIVKKVWRGWYGSYKSKRHSFLVGEEYLHSFVHPTPALLTMFGREHGGLGNRGYVLYLLQAYPALADVVVMYGVAIGFVADSVDPEKSNEIAEMLNQQEIRRTEMDMAAIEKVIQE
ncbi:MAG: hypothetical protein OXH19_05560 [Chloroflexi bacterium]|nr:hypothetical protein [Chloroflexota bacterium]MCY3588305.1 hypothetical protein [Chloroflexota bacterium]MCY3684876.1 hypothetical protein [Chloroflexota bacterium]MDE2708706.1 hypothetical protein [Chloroflexota bacterium]